MVHILKRCDFSSRDWDVRSLKNCNPPSVYLHGKSEVNGAMLVTCGCILWATATSLPPMPTCTNHTDLSVYPTDGEEGRSCTTLIRTAADWDKRRTDILVGFQAATGNLPARATMETRPFTLVSTVTLPGGIKRLNITYAGKEEDQGVIPAFLFVPPTATSQTPAPCVLASHPTSVEGKDYASTRAPPLDYAVELASRGCVRVRVWCVVCVAVWLCDRVSVCLWLWLYVCLHVCACV
jgi:hypothetical protein